MDTLAASKIDGTVNLQIKLIHITADAGNTFLAPLCPIMLNSTLALKDDDDNNKTAKNICYICCNLAKL
jgi:hypothetical protein